MAERDVEIMPRPPARHRPAVEHLEPSRGVLAALAEQLYDTAELHQRFLNAQAATWQRLISAAPAPPATSTRTAETEVLIGDAHLDGAGRLQVGAVVREALALLPHRGGVLDYEYTFHRPLPAPGERLTTTVTSTGTSFRGDIGDICSVRGTWAHDTDLGLPTHPVTGRSYGPDAVTAFAQGRIADCFTDPRWEPARAHVRSPGIGPRTALLLHEILAFDEDRNLIAEGVPVPETWASPAALLEGCVQTAVFQLAATGATVDRDGWRFEPVPGTTSRVRAHPTVHSGIPRYALTVREVSADTVHADVICVIDDMIVLRVERLAVRLVSDTPLPHWRQLGPPAVRRTCADLPLHVLGGLRGHHDPAPVASVGPIRYDHAALLASAWGPMHEVFGDSAVRGDDTFRLPGPPYLFITRLLELTGTPGDRQIGSRLVAEYDVPEPVWFTEHDDVVPTAVLMEIVLQPCGFLAAYVGSALLSERRLRMRNLDGDLTTVNPVAPGARSFHTVVELVRIDQWDDTVLETFHIRCQSGDTTVLDGTAVFVLSPDAALTEQTGMPVTDADRERLRLPCPRPVVDLRARPARWFGRSPRLPGPMLLMIDRISGHWPDGGSAGLGRLRAESDVHADAWYFKAHFFGDPVQPGSLGVEAMCQLLRYHLIEECGLGHGFRFIPEVPASWSYRGQVVPTDDVITIELEVLDVALGPDGGHADAEAWLWVDGRRAYHVPRLRVHVTPGRTAAASVVETVLDLAKDPWLADHCPTWTVPAVPMMSMADLLAGAVADRRGREVRVIDDVRVQRWLPVRRPARVRITCDDDTAELAAWHDGGRLSRFVPVATATIGGDPPPRPERFAPLTSSHETDLPYDTAELFHGPSFQYLTRLRMGDDGSSGVLTLDRGSVPRGVLHQGVLDAALHVVPHNDLWRWDRAVARDGLAFPHQLTRLVVHDPLPDTGEVAVEARVRGRLPDDDRLVAVDVQLCDGPRVLVEFRLVNMVLPVGALADVPGRARRAYLRDGHPDPRLMLSTTTDGDTVLRRADVERIDLLTGTANAIYGLPSDSRAADWLPHIAVKEHHARRTGAHPRQVDATDLHGVTWDDADTVRVRTT